MNIAFITSEYITEKTFDGGLANYLHRTALALQKRGHTVEIFTLSDLDGEIRHEGILVHRVREFPFALKCIWILTLFQLRPVSKMLMNSSSLWARVKRRHHEARFDVIQCASTGAVGFFTARQSKIPVITRISSYGKLWRAHEGCSENMTSRMINHFEIRQLRLSKAVYAPSRLIAGMIKDNEQVPAETIRPFYADSAGGRDDSVYIKELQGQKYFLFFGTVCKKKGVDVLMKAMDIILGQNPQVQFVLVGKQVEIDGVPFLEYMRGTCPGAAGSSQMKYLGALRQDQLYPILMNAHAVVLPSKIDNFPNTGIEAMALGKIVVGTRGSSYEEMLEDGRSGFLVEKEDPQQLAKAMMKVWPMGPDEIAGIGQNARQRILELTAERQIDLLLEYYQRQRDA